MTRYIPRILATRSAVLVIGLLQPIEHFGIHFVAGREADLQWHGLVNLRRLQTSAWLLPRKAQAEVNAVLSRRLYPGERPARRHERDIRLARLNNDRTEPRGGVDNSIEDWSQLWPIRVLCLDQLIGGSEQEVGIAEAFHHQERLGVAGHPVRGQPSAKVLLVNELFLRDTLIPGVDVRASALLEQAGGHSLHSLPVTSLSHRILHLCDKPLCVSHNLFLLLGDFGPLRILTDGPVRRAECYPL